MWRALIGLLLAAEARAAEPTVLSADHIELEAGEVEATGQVVLLTDGRRIEAETLRIAGGTFQLTGVVAEDQGLRIEADEASGTGQGLNVQGLYLDPCACCEGSPWSLSAREATLDEDALRFRGGWLLVAEHRALPLPLGRVPLQPPRVAPGLPVLGRGPDGFQVAVPVYLRPGPDTALTLTPELRLARGPRLSAAITHQGERDDVDLRASAARDLLLDQSRGAVGGQVAIQGGPIRAGASGELVSDGDWFEDYGVGLLDRQVPWTRQRAYLAAGPVRLEWLGWQLDAPTVEQVPSLVLADRGRRLGPLRTDSVARVDLMGGTPTGELGESAALRLTPGPTRLTLGADGRAGYTSGAPFAEGGADAEALLLVWGQHGPRTHQLGLGALGGVSGGKGEPAPLALPDPLGLAWQGLAPATAPHLPPRPTGTWLGPALESQWVGPEGSALVRVEAPWSPTLGPGAALSARLRGGAWTGEGSGAWRSEAWMLTSRLACEGERLRVGVGYVGLRGEVQVDQLRGDLALRLPAGDSVWTPSVTALGSPAGIASWETGLSWEASCGCAGAGLVLGFAEDREGPQLSAALSLRPGGSAKELR